MSLAMGRTPAAALHPGCGAGGGSSTAPAGAGGQEPASFPKSLPPWLLPEPPRPPWCPRPSLSQLEGQLKGQHLFQWWVFVKHQL